MKTFEEITNIISNMDDKTFETVNEAWHDMILEEGKTRRNARRRFLYNIKKVGLTEAEYDTWENN